MSLDRFSATEPELASLVSTADSDALRSASRVAVELALVAAVPAVDSVDVIEGLASLRRGSFSNKVLRRRLEGLWQDLDRKAFGASEAHPSDYLKFFLAARAINALWYALDPDARSAAQGAIYEALHAVDDPTEIRKQTLRTLALLG